MRRGKNHRRSSYKSKQSKNKNQRVYGASKTEKVLFYELNKIGLDPKPQYKINSLTVDFAFPEHKIAIEVDGHYHYGQKQKESDGNRDDFLQSEGWKVRRVSAKESYDNPSFVAKKIKNFVERNSNPKLKKRRKDKFDNFVKNGIHILVRIFLVISIVLFVIAMVLFIAKNQNATVLGGFGIASLLVIALLKIVEFILHSIAMAIVTSIDFIKNLYFDIKSVLSWKKRRES